LQPSSGIIIWWIPHVLVRKISGTMILRDAGNRVSLRLACARKYFHVSYRDVRLGVACRFTGYMDILTHKLLTPSTLTVADQTGRAEPARGSSENQKQTRGGRNRGALVNFAWPSTLLTVECAAATLQKRNQSRRPLVVNGNLTVRAGYTLSHQVEDRVLALVPLIAKVLVHVEPEVELLNPSQSDM
jgi:hypothetical protein